MPPRLARALLTLLDEGVRVAVVYGGWGYFTARRWLEARAKA